MFWFPVLAANRSRRIPAFVVGSVMVILPRIALVACHNEVCLFVNPAFRKCLDMINDGTHMVEQGRTSTAPVFVKVGERP